MQYLEIISYLYDVSTVINKIGTLYNQAYVLTEINDIGQQVVDILNNEIEYENILSSQIKGRAGQVIGGGLRLRTN
nr:MAG: hypothetical protein CM15mV30_1270 [uncultured marine virus]